LRVYLSAGTLVVVPSVWNTHDPPELKASDTSKVFSRNW
jgi:hypothetical protein